MTPRYAAKTDRNQAAIVEGLRSAGVVVHCTHRLGGGFPDLVAYSPRMGALVLLEVKMPGEALTDDEETFFETFEGAPIHIVYDLPDALAACGVEAYGWSGSTD